MAIRVNLGVGGFTGVVNLGSSLINLNTVGNNTDLAINTVSAVQGSISKTLLLPAPAASEEWAGSVIILKKIGPFGAGQELTINPADGTKLEGEDDGIIIDTEDQVVSFYYIDDTFGWLAGPATI